MNKPTEFKPAPRTGDASLDAYNDSRGFGALEEYDGTWICPDCRQKYAFEVKGCTNENCKAAKRKALKR